MFLSLPCLRLEQKLFYHFNVDLLDQLFQIVPFRLSQTFQL